MLLRDGQIAKIIGHLHIDSTAFQIWEEVVTLLIFQATAVFLKNNEKYTVTNGIKIYKQENYPS